MSGQDHGNAMNNAWMFQIDVGNARSNISNMYKFVLLLCFVNLQGKNVCHRFIDGWERRNVGVNGT